MTDRDDVRAPLYPHVMTAKERPKSTKNSLIVFDLRFARCGWDDSNMTPMRKNVESFGKYSDFG